MHVTTTIKKEEVPEQCGHRLYQKHRDMLAWMIDKRKKETGIKASAAEINREAIEEKYKRERYG